MPDPTIPPERWERVCELFYSALERPVVDRPAFLDTACEGDGELRAAVASLLKAHEDELPMALRALEPMDVEERLGEALKGRYEIQRPLGSGGMAMVFLAHDVKHRRNVAIKVLRPELAVSLGADRFLREIEIAAGLQHPHILPLFDSGIAAGLLYYVMPHVDGQTLAGRLARTGRLLPEESLAIADEVLGALAYAHRQGVVHRDVKPSNVLLSDATGHALVSDFGIARAISAAGTEALTVPGAVIGTPGYMPPEQARGEQATRATDVYATGLLLYECLTGRQYPEAGHTDQADWTGVPPGVRRVLARALQRRPDDRWPDAAAFRRALRGATSHGLRRPAQLGVIAAAVVVAVTAALWLRRGEPPPTTADDVTRVAVLPFSVRGSDQLEYLGEGMVDLLSTKLDGAGSWRSVDPRAVLGLVHREERVAEVNLPAARRTADRLGARRFVLGNVLEVGGRVRVDASLYATDGPAESLVQASAEGEEQDVLDLVDEVAAELLGGETEGADQRLTQIALVTSESLPALKSYLRGVRALRMAQFPAAAEGFQEAIASDSGFALAWYQLSVTADWLLRPDLAQDAAEQAVRFAARLSERDRRLLEALQTHRLGDVDRGERLYRAIIATYPDDVEAWSQLGELLFHFGPWRGRGLEESRPVWERLAQLEPDRATPYVHLARIETSRRNAAAVDTLTARALDLAPQGDRGLEMRLLRAFMAADRAAEEGVIAGFAEAGDDLIGEVIWSAGAYVRDQDVLERLNRAASRDDRSPQLRALGLASWAYLEAARGRTETTSQALARLATIDPVAALEHGAYLAAARVVPPAPPALRSVVEQLQAADWSAVPPSANPAAWFSVHDAVHPRIRWYLLGTLQAGLGAESAARAYADSLRAAPPIEGTGSLSPDLAAAIEAAVAWHRDDPAGAVAAGERARREIWHQLGASSPFFGQGHARFLRARALEAVGRLEEALRWYRSFSDTGPWDLVFLAPAHLGRARIYERIGDTTAAREHYERFLAWWADADPAYQPMVADARARLSALDPL